MPAIGEEGINSNTLLSALVEMIVGHVSGPSIYSSPVFSKLPIAGALGLKSCASCFRETPPQKSGEPNLA